jgi:hypothetical protein
VNLTAISAFTTKQRLCLAVAATVLVAGLLATASILGAEAGAATTGGISSTPSGGQTDTTAGAPTRSQRLASRYDRIWWDLRSSERRWANRTAECESGRDPRAIGGGGRYRGAFQFMKSTWNAAPKSPDGDPIRYTYRTQGVVAVMLKRRDGAGHWPVCG